MRTAGKANWANATARARARRATLLDRTKLRQLVKQDTDAISASIADAGYRTEMDSYAHRLNGPQLLEAALSHNLDREVHQVLGFCAGELYDIVLAYALRIDFERAKTVLRAIHSGADQEAISTGPLPAENPENTSWLQIAEQSNTLGEAAAMIRSTDVGGAFVGLDGELELSEYEDALDRHYFSIALTAVPKTGSNALLRRYLMMEIDHRNLVNLLRLQRQGLSKDLATAVIIPGGSLSASTMKSAAQADDETGLLDAARRTPGFNDDGLEEALTTSRELATLDPVVSLFAKRRSEMLLRFAHLHPLSAMPIVYYIERKLLEVQNLRLLVRGKAAGLGDDVLEAHMTL
jgi:V/A-type H+-transporting ATPase subunit C